MTSNDVFEQILYFSNHCGNVYLYGKGNFGKLMWSFLEDNGIHIAGFIVTENRRNVTEMRDHFGHVVPVYEKKEFLCRGGNGGIIVSMSEEHQTELDLTAFQSWKCLCLKDYQLNELGFYELIKITGKYRRISPLRVEAAQKAEKFFEKINMRKYASFGRQLNPWHMMPKFKKTYVKDIVGAIAGLLEKPDSRIVECGCGLCDILGSSKLKKYKRYGFDLDENVIYVDKQLFHDIEFTVGSFDKIQDMDISALIAVNFLHILPEDILRATFHDLFTNNRIQYFILDEVTGLYEHLHKFASILPPGCTLVRTLGPYESWGGVRYIKIFDMSGVDTKRELF